MGVAVPVSAHLVDFELARTHRVSKSFVLIYAAALAQIGRLKSHRRAYNMTQISHSNNHHFTPNLFLLYSHVRTIMTCMVEELLTFEHVD